MIKDNLDYGIKACQSLMNTYKPEDLPPKDSFFYIQGVFLSGMERIYKLTGDKKYFNYIKAYVDHVIGENGEIIGFDHEKITKDTARLAKNSLQMLDNKQPSILLYNLFDETGDPKYMNAIKTIGQSMYYWPINEYGGYWHMMTQHHQMWMDGAYMAGPLSVMYAARFGDVILRERAIKQVFIMNEHIRDEKTGLYYHGWDPTFREKWADPKTGLSSQFWGRAVGWYAVAILDILDYIPKDHEAVPRLKEIELDLLKSLVNFQDPKTGMWFNVLDKIEDERNWVETSCTSLFIYSYAKAMRYGIIGKEYEEVMMRAYKGLTDMLYYDENGNLIIDNVCIGTCIETGTYDFYVNRQKVKNDLHGAGAFILMCSELEEYNKYLEKNQ